MMEKIPSNCSTFEPIRVQIVRVVYEGVNAGEKPKRDLLVHLSIVRASMKMQKVF